MSNPFKEDNNVNKENPFGNPPSPGGMNVPQEVIESTAKEVPPPEKSAEVEASESVVEGTEKAIPQEQEAAQVPSTEVAAPNQVNALAMSGVMPVSLGSGKVVHLTENMLTEIGSEVSLDDEIKSDKLSPMEEFKDQETRRLFLPLGPTKFKKTLKFWHKESETSFRAPTHNPELLARIIEKLGKQPSAQFISVAAVYDTDKHGEFRSDRVELVAYRLHIGLFTDLSRLHKEWDLTQCDFKQTCKEVKFQNCTFVSCKGDIMLKSAPEAYQSLVAKAEYLYSTSLDYFMGKKMSDEEIIELLFSDEVEQPSTGVNPFAQTQVAGANTAPASATNDFSNLKK